MLLAWYTRDMITPIGQPALQGYSSRTNPSPVASKETGPAAGAVPNIGNAEKNAGITPQECRT